MFYKKNGEKQLSPELFKVPTCEYRGTPFWSWNTKLQENELLWQIEQLKEMGFGGFHMHSRSGMGTEYLGKDFMNLVKACNQKAKEENMLAYLYDEDRWPSGFAGGYVTKHPPYRQKFIRFTVNRNNDAVDAATGLETGKPYFLAAYDIRLNDDGTLNSYDRIGENDEAQGTKWYVYVQTPGISGRFNGYTYVDTLNGDAIDEYIRVTYDAYKDAVGEDFGGSVPSIFTDEPQFSRKQTLPFAFSKNDISLPFTTDLPESYRAATGLDLLEKLPELLWDLPDGKPSKARYLYHDHVCERFTETFADKCGKWCEDHGIYLTGHMMEEDSLLSQTSALGEAMRSYRSFGIPGIDTLCDAFLPATAKQCQSAVHQYGKEGMVSELYGVTGWHFDFRGHKYQGDWEAALGVTVRVPHLSWVSMKGSAKRDYPGSISYQSAWYKEYPFIEDHYARINTALTRGKPDVNVGVLHPIESYWLHFGPQENTAARRNALQHNFDSVTNWLLFDTVDFDYICESLLPSQYTESDDGKLNVGVMRYSTVIVPGMETMRSTTLAILKKFKAAGGKIIFMGECPKYIDAEVSDAAKELYEQSVVVPFSPVLLSEALKDVRDVTVKNADGSPTGNLLYNMRIDGDGKWLFFAHGRRPSTYNHMDPPQDLTITVKGEFVPTVYDTLTGETRPIDCTHRGGNTVFRYRLFCLDSLLVRLDNAATAVKHELPAEEPHKNCVLRTGSIAAVEYELSEPNVLVLDMAKVSWDGVNYEPLEEILRIDEKLRHGLKFPMANGYDLQPWQIPEEEITNFPYLKFEFESEIDVPCKLAFEEAVEVVFNGETVPVTCDGFFTDKSIHTMPMPNIRKGSNTLIVKAPLGKRISLENYFLLGQFGVRVAGYTCTVTALPEKLAFGSIVHQGFPFYGAAVTYKLPFEAKNDCTLVVRDVLYKGAMIDARLDGEELGKIVLPPYMLKTLEVPAGKHTLGLTLYTTRANCFAGLHDCSGQTWRGPNHWYTNGAGWAYEYQLVENGISKAPCIELWEIAAQ